MDFIPPTPTSSEESPQAVGVEMPANFISVIMDFANDLSTTFPEYNYLWDKWTSKETTIKEYEDLFLYCMKTYPERFFDILYQNDEIFDPENTTPTQFLPMVEFKMLFTCDNITPTIKQTLWKYLQLVLMTIMSSVKEKADFGDAANIFDGINEDELQGKLNDTIESLGNFFKAMDTPVVSEGHKQENPIGQDGLPDGLPNIDSFSNMFSNMADQFNQFGSDSNESSSSDDAKPNIPCADDINDHLKGIFNGKIGSLAKELADELSGDIMGMLGGEDAANGIKDTGDIFKKLMKNPKKIIDLLKTVSSKLNTKMKSGNISQEELMKEAGDLIGKMKGMGGGGEFSDIIKNLTKNMAGMGGAKGKMDMNAFSRMSSQQSMRERMKAKLDQKRAIIPLVSKTTPEYILESKNTPNNFSFKLPTDEVQEKSSSSIGQIAEESLTVDTAAGGKSNKKKNKKSKK
jgi:hypothetical protein